MSVIPCERNRDLRRQIEAFSEVLKTEAHRLGDHGLSEAEFYNSGLFRGAIERLRGQFAASMRDKREFVRHVLNHMQDGGFIDDWESAGEANRHDYAVSLANGRTAIIELKGCLDGNNTTIFERPPQADEFIIWSVCTNAGADPRHNAWSGIHTRLSAEIVFRSQRVDGIVIWDMVCGTIGRPCPKLEADETRATEHRSVFVAAPLSLCLSCDDSQPAQQSQSSTPAARATSISCRRSTTAFGAGQMRSATSVSTSPIRRRTLFAQRVSSAMDRS